MGKPSDKDFEKAFPASDFKTAVREMLLGRIASGASTTSKREKAVGRIAPQKKAGGGIVSAKGNGKAMRTKKCKMM